MTANEAIRILEKMLIVNARIEKPAIDIAIRSLEAWGEIIGHLKTTANELLSKEDENKSHAFAKGITFAVSMISVFLEEVEE